MPKTAAKTAKRPAPTSMATKPAAGAQRAYDSVAAAMARKGAVASKMFGMPTLKANGKAFAGLFHDAMTFKLKGVQHAAALALTGAKLFDPMGGRPMKEWVEVPLRHADAWPKLAEHARAYVSKG